jgi:hypothetical protein
MSLLRDAINHMDSVLFDQNFSESILYAQSGSDPVNIQASFQYGRMENADGIQGDGLTWQITAERDLRSTFNNGRTRDVATFIIRVSDIASPEYGDTIKIGDAVWTVTEIYDA